MNAFSPIGILFFTEYLMFGSIICSSHQIKRARPNQTCRESDVKSRKINFLNVNHSRQRCSF
jgi:hypothetical protein